MKDVLTQLIDHPRTKWMAVSLLVFLAIILGLAFEYSPASARTQPAATLCGNGSSPDYGFTYELMQDHWTVGWQGYASEQAVATVDTYLDELNADMIAQTMILILPQEKVGNRVNCAVHFLRYMQLGQPEGERKDNGFVFLIVVEPKGIDVHYGVGLGLPALTAQELTDLNRSAEAAFDTTGSLDDALISLIKDFDTVARENYAPLIVASPTSESHTVPLESIDIQTLCCLVCVGIIILVIIVSILSQLARSGISFDPLGSGSSGGWGSGNSGSSWGSGGGGWGGGSSSGGKSSTPRGGSGSGRSGRGN
jgi:hypothetical protein